jgi:hypothetical protein
MASDDPGYELVPDPPAKLAGWVRVALALMAAGFATVLGIAVWLDPYTPDGGRRTMSTHTQLGLPPCTFAEVYGKPCPSCGMTTSFALLAHGDPAGSLRANWVGTLLAAYLAVLVPWGLVGAWRGRHLWVRSGELLLTVSVGVLLVLLVGRWLVLLLL